MVNYNLILKLLDEGLKIAHIAKIVGCARGTVYKVRQLTALYGLPKNKDNFGTRKALNIYAPRCDLIFDKVFQDFLLGLPGKNMQQLYELYCSVSEETGVKVYSFDYFRHVLGSSISLKNDVRFLSTFRLKVFKADDDVIWVLIRSEDTRYLVYDSLPLTDKSPRVFFKVIVKLFQVFGCLPQVLCIDGRIKKEYYEACEQYCRYNQISLIKKPATDFFGDVLDKLPDLDLVAFNTARMQKGSSFSMYEAHLFEQRILKGIPQTFFEYIERKKVKVQIDFHVSINKTRYSVPFEYRHADLAAVIRDNVIDIYLGNDLICSHKKSMINYVTNPEHLPDDKDIPWDEVSSYKLRYIAKKIGFNTFKLVNYLLKSSHYEVYAYNICLFIINQQCRLNIEPICADLMKKKNITHGIVRTVFNNCR